MMSRNWIQITVGLAAGIYLIAFFVFDAPGETIVVRSYGLVVSIVSLLFVALQVHLEASTCAICVWLAGPARDLERNLRLKLFEPGDRQEGRPYHSVPDGAAVVLLYIRPVHHSKIYLRVSGV